MNIEEENYIELLKLYKEQEILWNPKHPSYKSVELTSIAWHQCSSQMAGMSVGEFQISINRILKKYTDYRQNSQKKWFQMAESFLASLLFPDKQVIFFLCNLFSLPAKLPSKFFY
jgi:hypothetical protein